jgi:spore protease
LSILARIKAGGMKMQKIIDEFKLHIDLAVEARDLVRGTRDIEVPGVEEKVEEFEHVKITTISILNQIGAEKMGKPIGTYITIETPPQSKHDGHCLLQLRVECRYLTSVW